MLKTKKLRATFVFMFFIMIAINLFSACSDSEEITPDYPVAGIWHATATWIEESPYDPDGDTVQLDIYFDFREDGTLKNKRTLSINGYALEDSFSDWIIVNLTWSVKGNIITLSSGKQYVIVDDGFDDMYPEPKMVLHYKKESSEIA